LITIHRASTERAEAEFVVQSLEQLLGGHSFFSLDSGRSVADGVPDLSFSDFAVLYRTEAQTPAIIEALARSGMPFQKRSHTLLMDHPGVPELLDHLRQTLSTGPIVKQLDTVLAPSQAWDDAAALLKPLALACDRDWERFWSEIAIGSQVDTWDPRADCISLLTLHAAKGLEFPVVFILGCEAGILPLTWGEPPLTEMTTTETDEERRLFYVGITRAQRRLYLCHAQKRLWRGRVQERMPSPYLSDLDEQLLERRKAPSLAKRARQRDHQLELF
jgi:superfamily I DNA/RNA helicase